MEWTDHALVLRVGKFRESDLWLKLLTQSHGLLTAFAFGGSRSRRRFCGCLDTFNTLQCRIKSNKNNKFLYMEEAVLLDSPKTLHDNWKKMGIATNCIRFVESLGVDDENAQKFFLLIEDLKISLGEHSNEDAMLPLYFRLHVAGLSGYEPNLRECALCGTDLDGSSFFMVNEGNMVCERCYSHNHLSRAYAVKLTRTGLENLQKVQYLMPTQWGQIDFLDSDRKACAQAIDGFIQYHLGLSWEGCYFRRV